MSKSTRPKKINLPVDANRAQPSQVKSSKIIRVRKSDSGNDARKTRREEVCEEVREQVEAKSLAPPPKRSNASKIIRIKPMDNGKGDAPVPREDIIVVAPPRGPGTSRQSRDKRVDYPSVSQPKQQEPKQRISSKIIRVRGNTSGSASRPPSKLIRRDKNRLDISVAEQSPRSRRISSKIIRVQAQSSHELTEDVSINSDLLHAKARKTRRQDQKNQWPVMVGISCVVGIVIVLILAYSRYPDPVVSGTVSKDGKHGVWRGSYFSTGNVGGTMHLGGYCDLDLDHHTEIMLSNDGEPKNEKIFLEKGTVKCRIKAGRGQFTVRTQAGSASTRGAVFTVGYRAKQAGMTNPVMQVQYNVGSGAVIMRRLDGSLRKIPAGSSSSIDVK